MKMIRCLSIISFSLFSLLGKGQSLTLHLPEYPHPHIRMVSFSITNVGTGENIQSSDTSFNLPQGKYKINILPYDLFDTIINIKNKNVRLDLSQVNVLQNDHLKFYEALDLSNDTVNFSFFSQGCFGGLRQWYFGRFWFEFNKKINLIGYATDVEDSSKCTIRADYSELIEILFHAAYPEKSWSTTHHYMVLRTRKRFLLIDNAYLQMFSMQKIE